ncbi:MAG: 5'/3'-nucleotidase SurE [Vicingaceae bacterium]|jgi:5'-nucleotidase|nr:5'/3'-nucleotidase SurE [Bacteroidota bacterium]MDF1675376.1 5'/3'-nucleotidase SurE [Vicingaceae bacterium]MDF1864364.1 5'/3'-nucleotidase SurE [Saprospiraceae bacterium]
MKKPLILVTNDDGINAPGIKALVEAAKEFGEVVVVAPDSPQSGQGHAITISKPVWIKKVEVFDGIDSYECSGTPVDCVKLAQYVILKGRKADLCISGINHGSNASINIIYSGTMSAAMEASLEGIESIGFSLLDFSWSADFNPAKKIAKQIIQQVLEKGMGSCKLLNVNIPNVPEEDIKGIKICRQADGRWLEGYQESTDPRGKPYYWLSGEFVNPDKGTDTDIWALDNGYVSVVPSGHDLTKYDSLLQMNYLESSRIRDIDKVDV